MPINALLASIRAYGAETAFTLESTRRIDKYTRAARSFYNLNRWICIRIDAIGGLFAAGLGAYLIYGPRLSTAGDTGFTLTMARVATADGAVLLTSSLQAVEFSGMVGFSPRSHRRGIKRLYRSCGGCEF